MVTRRACLALLAGAPAAADTGKGRIYETDAVRFSDPATEFPVERLTDPSYSSLLPAHYARAFTRRGASLLFACDRPGSEQAFRLEIKTTERRQLTEVQGLDPSSLHIFAHDNAFGYPAGRAVFVPPWRGREREVYHVEDGWEPSPGLAISVDGVHGILVERKGETSRIRLITMARAGGARTILETPGMVDFAIPRPRRASVVYRKEGALWLAHYDGELNRRLPTAQGKAGMAHWSPDGRTVQYLLTPDDPTKLVALREIAPDVNQDALIANTSQFASFARNVDGSVFLGASRSVASPHMLLLVRAVKRELTLCEHKASDPAMINPMFSPTSQRVYFVSDKQGKPAIYSMAVDRLVERTES